MFIMLHFYIIMLHYANAILLKFTLVYVIPQVPVFFVLTKNKSIVSVIL